MREAIPTAQPIVHEAGTLACHRETEALLGALPEHTCGVQFIRAQPDKTWQGIIPDIACSIVGGPKELWEMKCIHSNP